MNKMSKKNTSAGYAEVQDYDHVVKMLKNSSEFYTAKHNLLKKTIRNERRTFLKRKMFSERIMFFHVI